ncbi:fibronectin type III domain-containing protein 7-like [Sinocyclocheilus anshuiensis]|uniref:fibronectin type III domain-containing protein 7-like n=1 Tax=Sinocyclocheilus anshuiensis TaxID=1608454 RepID=UPI0007B80857|nr:PREDICTED: fibronectin type III domain-containing protein 7-like [Sinocyclocheilus anshuiensis]
MWFLVPRRTVPSLQMVKAGRSTALQRTPPARSRIWSVENAPCPPKAPKVYRECSTNVILFSWEPTNNTAYYFAIAVDSDDLVMECVTVETSCYFTDTVCGQTYSFYVSAVYSGGLDCNSGNTEGVVIKTAPCLPQNIYTIANCNSISSAIITWDEAAGAEAYVVEARGNRKDFYNCTSANTSCTITDLDCGESLSVWIVATNGECTTDPVLGDVAETVPCIPQNVSAVETCSSDSASLTWNYANGAIFYIGMATHVNGTVHTCVAMAAECTIPDLRCGEAYDVYVMSTNLKCNSSESQHVTLQTAPCDPQNITTVLQCDTNTANVTWAASAGANGLCFHITSSSLLFSSLLFSSLLPCIPTNVAAALNCTSNIASITWHNALGATWYLVKAEGNQGYKTSCNNTVTHCDIPNLQCGQEYSITVMGMNGDCMGPASQPVTLVSAPCPNTGIQASLDCSTNSALISWTPGNGSLSFNAILQSFQDPQKHNCFTNGSSCSISSLPCGQHYNISVTGHGQTCSTSSKTLVTLDMAPCVPTQVNVSLSCGSDTASVSWAASSGLVSYYTVTAVDDNGHTLTCNSSSTSCDISGLACGQAYNVSVTAMSVDCTGQRSDVRRINTAPCAPQSVVSQLLDCQTGDVQISWQSSKGAQIYYAQAKSTDKTLVCNSTSTSCIIPALGCGQTYNITVVAEANGCSSNTSAISQVTAAPCPPTSVAAVLDCSTNTVLVSWSSLAISGVHYTASAIGPLGPSSGVECNTTNLNCTLAHLQCGSQYNVTVTATQNNCTSKSSTEYSLITG